MSGIEMLDGRTTFDCDVCQDPKGLPPQARAVARLADWYDRTIARSPEPIYFCAVHIPPGATTAARVLLAVRS